MKNTNEYIHFCYFKIHLIIVFTFTFGDEEKKIIKIKLSFRLKFNESRKSFGGCYHSGEVCASVCECVFNI